jgi:CHAT domain-containing protein
VPFAVLMPDVDVAYEPSGTTYRLLLEEGGARGEGILALGDPDYRTRIDGRAVATVRGGLRLLPLSATREEATAVGTVTLLGVDASELGLREALLRKPRWRSVHLACHGLLNDERPALSSLALTATPEDNGFLTCLDVFRMRVPADLVVLSACETGKGKVVKGEGIVGLTRAFMFAGAPRVICSLWKVDDEATRALMVKFYELWNPKDGENGLGAAAALSKAQEFIRSQAGWKHPYHWAAWVLWGLPE